MRISDWSSDVCSSDLIEMRHTVREHGYGAAALSCAGDDGIAFTDLACAPTASRFIDGRLDNMQLCLVAEGQFGFTHGNDVRERLGPGPGQIGREHVCTPVTNANLVCRLLLEKT